MLSRGTQTSDCLQYLLLLKWSPYDNIKQPWREDQDDNTKGWINVFGDEEACVTFSNEISWLRYFSAFIYIYLCSPLSVSPISSVFVLSAHLCIGDPSSLSSSRIPSTSFCSRLSSSPCTVRVSSLTDSLLCLCRLLLPSCSRLSILPVIWLTLCMDGAVNIPIFGISATQTGL